MLSLLQNMYPPDSWRGLIYTPTPFIVCNGVPKNDGNGTLTCVQCAKVCSKNRIPSFGGGRKYAFTVQKCANIPPLSICSPSPLTRRGQGEVEMAQKYA